MTYLITVIAAVTFSYYFVEVLAIHKVIKRFYNYAHGKRLKPLDCVQCLSVWVCILLLMLPDVFTYCTATLFTAGYIGRKIK